MLDKSILDNLAQIKKSILVYDVETSSYYPDGREVNLSTDFESYIKYAKVKWFGAYSYLHDKLYLLKADENAQLIMQLLQEHDTLCGFNSEDFDFPILNNNGYTDIDKKYTHIDMLQILGTANFTNKSGYAYKNRALLMDYKLKNNSLRCMAETLKVESLKGDIDWKIFQQTEWTPEEETEIKKYLHNDIMATKQLFEKVWDYWLPFTKLLDVKSIYDLSWIKSAIASLTYKAACKVLNTEATYSNATRVKEDMGGNVYLPKYEETYNGWHVDVGSMHPHMISMANLPAEVNPENISSKRKIWHGNKVFQVKGYYDITEWHPLAKYIAEKLKERITLKKTDPKNPFIYTLKIFLNGLYGIIRSPKFEKVHKPNAGWDTCYLSQQVQALMKEMFEQFGFEVVQGDTDAVDIVANEGTPDTREYVQQCIDTIVEIVKDNFPFPVDTFNLAIEYRFDYLMVPFSEQPVVGEDGKKIKFKNRLVKERVAKKKNYLMMYKENGKTIVKLVGLPIKKDNATALGMKIYDDILEQEIIKTGRAKFQKEFIESKVNEYLQRPEIMELISQEYKVKPASTYKKNSQIQAQISKGYFKGMGGVIRLIKNTKVGNAGKGTKYCSIQEAIEAKLTIAELDLEKVFKELDPFIEYKEPKKVLTTDSQMCYT